MSPKDAGMAALKRVRTNTVEARLLNERGLPNFDLRFFILNKAGDVRGRGALRLGGEDLRGLRRERRARGAAGGAAGGLADGLMAG